MITDTAEKLLASFNGDKTCNNDLFMNYNQYVSAILDIICSNTQLSKSKFHGFSRKELMPIAQNFLLHKNTNLFHKISENSDNPLTTDFIVDNTGKFHVVIPHLSFFFSQLGCQKENGLKHFEKKILKPYSKQIVKGKPLSEKFLQRLQKNLQKMLGPTTAETDKSQLYSKYIVDSIFNNPEFIRETIHSSDNKPSLGRFSPRIGRSSAIFQALKQEFASNKFNLASISNSFSSVNQLYYTSKATLTALSTDLRSLSPEALEQKLIELNDMLMLETGNYIRYYKPGQYREQPVEVGLKQLVLNGDKGFVEGFDIQCCERISAAMKPLSEDIICIAQNASNMSQEEYIKQVSTIHFRYINIHPFSDGNGRTGRLLINMLLKEKGIIFDIESRESKIEYLQAMNTVEDKVLENITSSDYLANLYTNPSLNKSIEEASIGPLSNFITTHSFAPGVSRNDSKTQTQELQSEYINPDPDLLQDL